MTEKKKITVLDVLQAMKDEEVEYCGTENLSELNLTKRGTKLTIGVPGDQVGAIALGRKGILLFIFDIAAYRKALAELEPNR